MPFIQVKLIDKVLTTAQKKETIAMLKDAIVAIQRQLERPVPLIVIEEKSDDANSAMWDWLSSASPELNG